MRVAGSNRISIGGELLPVTSLRNRRTSQTMELILGDTSPVIYQHQASDLSAEYRASHGKPEAIGDLAFGGCWYGTGIVLGGNG